MIVPRLEKEAYNLLCAGIEKLNSHHGEQIFDLWFRNELSITEQRLVFDVFDFVIKRIKDSNG